MGHRAEGMRALFAAAFVLLLVGCSTPYGQHQSSSGSYASAAIREATPSEGSAVCGNIFSHAERPCRLWLTSFRLFPRLRESAEFSIGSECAVPHLHLRGSGMPPATSHLVKNMPKTGFDFLVSMVA